MSEVSRSSVHILVSEGWDDDEELLECHVECPEGCDDTDENPCNLQELLYDIDYVREKHLRVPGRYPFQAVYTRDYWGEHDVDIVETPNV